MTFTRWAVLLLLIVPVTPKLTLAEGPPSITPDELKMTSDPLAPGAPAIILYRQVDRDDNAHTGHESNFVRVKILKDEGRKYADVEIPFLHGNGRNIVNISGRTIRPDGSVAEFKGKPFDKTIVKAKGVKYMAKTFTLPDIQVGCVVEYSYTMDFGEYMIYDSHWILSDGLFTKHAKFSLKPYNDDYGTFHLSWSWNFLPTGTNPPKEAPDHIIRMDAQNIPAFETEDYMPPENELKSRVDFTYSEQDEKVMDPPQYWKAQGKKLNGKVEGFVGKRKAMEQALAEIVQPNDPPETKLRKIYARVQQLRNFSFEDEKTEQEEKREKLKQIGNVEDLWKRGYGNGAQITWLFLGLARAAGIEAYPVYVSRRSEYFFNPQRSDKNQLDDNVVLVKLDGKDLYLDPGTIFTPFGLLPWAETGVQGLKLDKDGGTWVTTTLPPASASSIHRKADLKLTDAGSLEGKLTVTFAGLEALRRRIEERNEDDTDRKKMLEDEVKECVPAAIDVELTNKPDWKSSSDTLVAEFSLKVPGWVAGAGRKALLSAGLFAAPEKQVFEKSERVHPIYFDFPSERDDDVAITVPTGWQISSLPAPIVNDGKLVLYSLKAENDSGTLRISRKVNLDLLLLPQKYYLALRNFFQAVRSGDETQIILQPGAATASN
jgi:hypothetical protein